MDDASADHESPPVVGAAHPAARESRVLDTGALRALAHPLRVQLYDMLAERGPQTASSLAELTGESTGSTSYHLRALAKHDLIREVPGRGSGRERWWERPRGAVQFGNPESLKTPAGRAATQVVVAEHLTRRHQQLMQYISRSIQNPDADTDDAMITTAGARLTPAQLHELTERMSELIDEYTQKYRDQEGEDVRHITIRADIFPLPEEGR